MTSTKQGLLVLVREETVNKKTVPTICMTQVSAVPYLTLSCLFFQAELSFLIHSLYEIHYMVHCLSLYLFQTYYTVFEMSRILFKIQIHMCAKYPNSPSSQWKLGG